jgi:carbon storage regulator
MLYLTRKIGESVIINDDIEVTVIDIRGKSIKLGFTFPTDATVLRREIFERIQAENRAAAAGTEALAQAIKSRAPAAQRQGHGPGQPKGDLEPSG